jgi:S-disulfanyl-L-cysteine oxidoreductase SoxD
MRVEPSIRKSVQPSIAVAVCVLAVGAWLSQLHTAAQSSDGKIWEGIYTKAQAERGKQAYETNCVRCHAGDLTGLSGPALKGDPFMKTWRGENLNALFVKMRDTMPPGLPAGVPTETKVDLLAYVLQANGFPDGKEPLPQNGDSLQRSREFEQIEIVARGAQLADVPDFSLVQVVGCLAPASDKTWMLSSATDPVTTRDTPTDAEGRARAAARPLGQQRFTLVSVGHLGPSSHSGHRVEIKGLLSRAPDENRINVVSLQMLAPACS